MKMPFGKYKGVETEEVPIDYLEWFIDNCREKVNDDLFNEVILLVSLNEALESDGYYYDTND